MTHEKIYKIDGWRFHIKIALISSTWSHEKSRWDVQAFCYAPNKRKPSIVGKDAVEIVAYHRIQEVQKEFIEKLLKLPLI